MDFGGRAEMQKRRVCETDRPDVKGSAYGCTCERAQRAKQGGTAGNFPVPAEMQGQVFLFHITHYSLEEL